MAATGNSFSFSSRAAADLRDIYLVSIELFGPQQALRYQQRLDHTFQLLADNPRLGRLAPRAGSDVRRHEHAAHVIFYRATGDGVLILGVVHARRMRGLHF